VARQVGDPSDAIWITTLGGSWVVIGAAIRGFAGSVAPCRRPEVIGRVEPGATSGIFVNLERAVERAVDDRFS